jgi:hypothetical protein
LLSVGLFIAMLSVIMLSIEALLVDHLEKHILPNCHPNGFVRTVGQMSVDQMPFKQKTLNRSTTLWFLDKEITTEKSKITKDEE